MKRIALALAGIALLMAAPLGAQGSTLDLSADDYALLSAATSTPLTSFAFDYKAHLAVAGLDNFAVAADFNGTGALDHAAPAFDATVAGTLTLGTAQTIPLNDDFRWINDTLYLNPGDGWQAHGGATALLADLIQRYTGLAVNDSQLATWDASAIDGVSDILAALSAADPATFLTAQRLADETAGSTPTAHFQISADLHALMQTDAFTNAVAALADSQGTNLVIYDPGSLGQIVRANSAMFANATVTLDEYVGLSDHLPYGIVLSLNLPITPAAGSYPDAPFTVNATLDLTLSGQNQPQTIAAPDNASVVPDFSFPAPPTPAAPGGGLTQYVYLQTIAASAAGTQTFDAQAGDHVTITVRGLGLDFDGIAALFSPSGATLAQNDNHDHPGFGLGDYDPQIADFAIPASGTYTVSVTEYDGNAGSYVLTISIQR